MYIQFSYRCIIVVCVLLYLEHVRVFVMAVLYNHCLVSGQRVGDTVLALTVYSLQQNSNNVCYSLATATTSVRMRPNKLFSIRTEENIQRSLARALFSALMYILLLSLKTLF